MPHEPSLGNSLKKLVLLRHSESLTNLDFSHYGHFSDESVPLSDAGKIQAAHCGSYWGTYCNEKQMESVLLLHSHYLRAKDTADIIASVLQDFVYSVHCKEVSYIHEQIWPNCIGIPAKSVGVYLQECLKKRHHKGMYQYKFPRGGENGKEVAKRAGLFIEELQTEYLLISSDLIIIITHSYFIRVLLKELFGWSIEVFNQVRKLGNCEGYTLSIFNGALTLNPNQLVFKDPNEMD